MECEDDMDFTPTGGPRPTGGATEDGVTGDGGPDGATEDGGPDGGDGRQQRLEVSELFGLLIMVEGCDA